MSLVLLWNSGERAFILSDGLALDGEGEIITRDRRKFFKTASGAIIGACGLIRLCDELEQSFRNSAESFGALVASVSGFVARANAEHEATKFSKPLGAIVAGIEDGLIRSAEISATDTHLSTPGRVHVAWVSARPEGFDEIGRFLGAMTACPAKFIPDYFRSYAQGLFSRFPGEAGGEMFAEELSLEPPEPELSDPEGSTTLNQQGSNNSFALYGNNFTYTSTDNSVTWTWIAFGIPLPNGGTFSIPANATGDTITGLSPSTTYYFGLYLDLKASSPTLGAVIAVLSDVSGGTGPESQQQVIAVINGDSHTPLAINLSATTAAIGGNGAGSGGSESTCPAEDQPFETFEKGFIPAGQLQPGMHAPGWGDEWNEIEQVEIVDGSLHYVTIAGETFHVDVNHRWLPPGVSPDAPLSLWKRSGDMKPGEQVQAADGSLCPVESVSEPHPGRYVEIRAERQRFRLGQVIAHNFLTLPQP